MTFQPLDRDLDDDELVELERFLASPALVKTSMDLYGVDGYFAAILSGPRTLMPSEWVAWVWDSERGERAPEFEDLRHAERILALLMRHYNSVAHALMDEGETFAPIYPNDETDAAISWCAGYLTGLALDAESWKKLVNTEPRWFAPILGLGTVEEEGARPDSRQLVRWSREVGRSVARIHGHWLEKRRAPPPGLSLDRLSAGSGPRPAAAPRAGRNEPCPCGSGKKFKRCCGAASPF